METQPTFKVIMKTLAEEADADEDVCVELHVQGESDNGEALREHIIMQSEPVVIAMIFPGGMEVELMHSSGIYASPTLKLCA